MDEKTDNIARISGLPKGAALDLPQGRQFRGRTAERCSARTAAPGEALESIGVDGKEQEQISKPSTECYGGDEHCKGKRKERKAMREKGQRSSEEWIDAREGTGRYATKCMFYITVPKRHRHLQG